MAEHYKVGDTVTWSSQSGGFMATKTGVVVRVVDINERVDAKDYRCARFGSGRRKEVGFIIKVGVHHYWPRSAWLRKGSN